MAALAVVLLVGVSVAEFMGWPFLRQPLNDVATRAAGVPVGFDGPFRLHLLGRARVRVGHLRVGAADGVAAPHLVDAAGVELALRWIDIWRWRRGAPLRVETLRADRMDARLVRRQDGRASWKLGADGVVELRSRNDPELPRFGLLQVEQGRVVVDDAPTATRLDLTLRGSEGAGFDIDAKGSYQALALKLQIHASGALALVRDAEGGSGAPMAGLRVQGELGAAQVSFDGKAAAVLGARRVEGDFRLSGPSLAEVAEPFAVTLPRTPAFEIVGKLAHDDGLWRLEAERFAVGTSVLGADVVYDSRTEPPSLSGRVGGPRLVLADLGPAIGTTPARQAGDGERVLPDRPFDLPSLKAMDADVDFAVDEFDFGSAALRSMTNLRAHLLLRGGVLRLEDLRAALAGGRFAGRTQLDGTREPARWEAALNFDNVDIARWIPALRRSEDPAARGPASSEEAQAYITGELTGNVDVRGAGRSTATILGSLDGESLVVVRDATLSHLVTELIGLDLAQALGVAVRGDDALPLRCGRIDMAIDGGVVQLRNAVFDNRDSTIRVLGRIDLGAETMALRARARPKDFSPMSLRTPITIGGTLGSPVIGIEGTQLAGKALGAVALGALLGPITALVPFVDFGDDERQPCAPPAAPSARPGHAEPGNEARGSARQRK